MIRAAVAFLLGLTIMWGVLGTQSVWPRDIDGRYAGSPNKAWFDGLKSKKGPCCSDADGSAVTDADWDTKNGHYRVRIEGQWWDVPENAVITEPNRDGRTIVWPIHLWDGAKHTISIRCFIPGSMT